MKLSLQKRLAAQVMKGSLDRVWFDPAHLEEIKDAITKDDIRGLITQGIIKEKTAQFQSRFRARKIQAQKRKGLRTGQGSRKGLASARGGKKETWVAKVRVQREFVKHLLEREVITKETYNDFYRKVKGGFFRSTRHIKLYLNDNNLALKK